MTHKSFVQRVRQVDTVELDKHLLEVFKLQVSKITNLVGAGTIDRYQPEINLLISFLIWKFSVWEQRATYGQQLLNIKYGASMSRKKAIAWAILTMLPKYVKERYMDLLKVLNNDVSSDWVRELVEWGETALQLAGLANALVFLVHGRYPTLVDRALTQDVVTAWPEPPAGYQFLTRELLWHTLVDVFTFVLPLVNYHYTWRKLRSVLAKRGVGQSGSQGLTFTPATRCPICEDSPVNPYHMGCAHVFCYYCLQAHCLADAKFECPLCGQVAEDCGIRPVLQASG
ncbi:peroxisome biogenesis factor 2 isoform X3 [Bacillus rossius redtenbacheri]|uniref:peroxisome biogenesis factor 2 isoform X3 n=1 Tax=Bacillus rossius redtenbacheri TaxID=93214 RepID=UPI002FDDC908